MTDLRAHLKKLEEQGDLVKISREMNKDTEIHPFVRWQFRGLPESERKAFLFEHVVDSRGRKFDFPVVVGALSASERIYNTSLGGEDSGERWKHAFDHPIPPRIVESGPVQEVVHMGDSLLEDGGLDELPVPISTPGFDNAPYFNSAIWIVRDPETGIMNAGVYRSQIKDQLRTGIYAFGNNNLARIWEKCNAMGVPLQAAAVIGADPKVYFSAIQLAAMGVDEMGLAGALNGSAIEMVRCKTIDLEVPAHAEIVIEGTIRTDVLEPEGSFGEAHGYSDPRALGFVFEASCFTHRKNPIYLSILSQVTPSESSKSKQSGYEADALRFLQKECGLKGVLEVVLVEELMNRQMAVIRMKKTSPYEPNSALHALLGRRQPPKFAVAVDEDIDPRDAVAVNWAIINRCQPHRDVEIVRPRPHPFGPLRLVADDINYDRYDSSILIDATKKRDLPPVGLPAKEYMENARKIWEELGMPSLQPRAPWYGYSLGFWPEESRQEAELATQGRYFETGGKLSQQQVAVEPGTILAEIRGQWQKKYSVYESIRKK